jgi:hypothetical protein
MPSIFLVLALFLQVVFGFAQGDASYNALKSCVTDVLGKTAPHRIVTSSDDTYTDARLGETIQ